MCSEGRGVKAKCGGWVQPVGCDKKQVGKSRWGCTVALFSLPNNLFCVDNVKRIYRLI